jgi:DNA-binding winged helix-turn-helix (wHTH) protein/predicted ATPase
VTPITPLVQFGPFTFDARTGSLWQGTVLLPSHPKDAAVLQILLQHAGQVVSHEALLEAVWPETFVTKTVLKNCVNRLRRLLEDEPTAPRYIETWRRRGYRFIGPLTAAPERAIEPGWDLPQTLSSSSTTLSPQPSVLSPVLLVGREREWQLLLDWFGLALAGHRQVVFISGEPGMGKTALVEAFVAHVAARGASWVGHGQCREHYGRGEPYHPVLEALDRLCRGPSGGRLVEILRQEAPTWLTQLPGLLSAPEAEALQRLLPHTTRARMLRELAVALERVTAETPLVLVMEDLQWSDYGTVDLLTTLAQRPDPARLLVLATCRPAEIQVDAHPLHRVILELRLHGQCQELALPALSESAVTQYLGARAPQVEPSTVLGRWLHRWTGGHPLFLVLLVEDLEQQGGATAGMNVEDAARRVQGLQRRMPERLRQLIEMRVARLTAAEQQLLDVASVAGEEFSAAAVAAGLAGEVIPIEARCEVLARRGDVLEPRGTVIWPDGTVAARYGFRHALYQQVVYDRIPAARRQHLHRQIALRLEQAYGDRVSEIATTLAMHWQQGWDTAQAIRHRQHAAENALQHQTCRETINNLTMALALLQALPESPERAQHELALQIMLYQPMSVTKGYAAPEVEQVLARARQLCQHVGDASQLFRVLFGLRVIYLQRADLETPLELERHLLGLAQRPHDPVLFVAAHQALVTVLFWRGELAQARAHVEEGPAVYEAQHTRLRTLLHGYDLGAAYLAYGSWTLWLLGYPDQGLQMSQEAQTLARELAHPFSLAIALSDAASMHQFRREASNAQERAEAAVTIADGHGFPFFSAWGTMLHGWALAEQGRGAEGIAQLRQGLAAHHAIGSELARPYFLALLAEACGRAGQADEGLQLVNKAFAVAHHAGERQYEAELYRLKGELLLQIADTGVASATTEAERCFRQALATARRQQAKALELRAAMSLGRLWQQQGKRAHARRILAPIYGWFTEGFDTTDLQEAQALLRELGVRTGSSTSRKEPGEASLSDTA